MVEGFSRGWLWKSESNRLESEPSMPWTRSGARPCSRRGQVIDAVISPATWAQATASSFADAFCPKAVAARCARWLLRQTVASHASAEARKCEASETCVISACRGRSFSCKAAKKKCNDRRNQYTQQKSWQEFEMSAFNDDHRVQWHIIRRGRKPHIQNHCRCGVTCIRLAAPCVPSESRPENQHKIH